MLFVFEHFAWFPGVKCLLASGHFLDQNEQKWDLEGVMRQVVAGTTTIEEDQLGMGISWEMLTRVTWIGSNDAKVKVAITTVTLVLSTRCNYIYNGKNSFIGLLGS